MLSDHLITSVGEFIKEQIKTAVVVFEDKEPEEVTIMRKDVNDDTLKVFVNTTKGAGTITDIRLLDENGKVLISKPKGRIKTLDHAMVTTFWLRILEEEVEKPINIYELEGGYSGR